MSQRRTPSARKRKRTQPQGAQARPTVSRLPADDRVQLPVTRFDGHLVGIVTLDRQAIRNALHDSFHAVGRSDDEARAGASWLLDLMLSGLATHIGRYIEMQVALDPLVLATARWNGRKRIQFFLSALQGWPPDALAELSTFPSGRTMVRQIQRHGTRNQRTRLKRLLAQRAAGAAGRPRTSLRSRQDAELAAAHAKHMQHLQAGFDRAQHLRRGGGYRSDAHAIGTVLRQMGYDTSEVTAITASRTVSAAANRTLADETRMTHRTVSARVSRGRHVLADADRSALC